MLAFTLVVLLGLLGLSVAAAVSVGLLGMSLAELFSTLPLSNAMGEIAWSTGAEFLLVAIPLYILMGELLVCSGVAGRMYGAADKWLSWLPGGLMNSNIGASALFSATSGSSVATAATISTIALPEQERKGYPAPLFLGSIAAGGTLGILIPPSINMILFALIANLSVPKLYLAATIPGLLLCVMFVAMIVITCMIWPNLGGIRQHATWAERLASIPDLLPPMAIFVLVVGAIYSGFATASESAALGVLAAFGLGLIRRTFTWQNLGQAFESTMRTSGMIIFITLSAFFLNFVLSAIGLTPALVSFITGLELSPMATLLAIILFYIILGCFMDTLAMLITTAPLVVPVIVALGFDPLWFGVILIILCELGQITPPFGMNLFVVQSIRNKGNFMEVIMGVLPFCLVLLLLVALLILFPALALWLPQFA